MAEALSQKELDELLGKKPEGEKDSHENKEEEKKTGVFEDSEGNKEFWKNGEMYAKKFTDGRFIKFRDGKQKELGEETSKEVLNTEGNKKREEELSAGSTSEVGKSKTKEEAVITENIPWSFGLEQEEKISETKKEEPENKGVSENEAQRIINKEKESAFLDIDRDLLERNPARYFEKNIEMNRNILKRLKLGEDVLGKITNKSHQDRRIATTERKIKEDTEVLEYLNSKTVSEKKNEVELMGERSLKLEEPIQQEKVIRKEQPPIKMDFKGEKKKKRGFLSIFKKSKNKKENNADTLKIEEKSENNLSKVEPQKELEKETEDTIETKEAHSETETSLIKKRNAYIQTYGEWKVSHKNEKEEKKQKLDSLYKEYRDERVKSAKQEYEKKKQELEKNGKTGEELEKELKLFQVGELFNKYVLEEENILNGKKIEAFPKRERGIIKRGIDKWIQLPKVARWAISASVATGIAVGAGVVGVGAAAGYATTRFARGVMGGTAAIGTNAAFTGLFSTWDKITGYNKKQEQEFENIKKSDDFVKFFSQNLEKIEKLREDKAKREKRKEIAKLIGSAGAGIFVGMEAGSILHHLDVAFGTHLGTGVEHVSGGKTDDIVNETPPQKNIADIFDQNSKFLEQMKEGAKRFNDEQMRIAELATVHKGEGAWHAVYRQFEDQVQHNQNLGKFGLKPEDLDNAEKVKHALNKATQEFLEENGYIKPDGSIEEWVKTPGTKIFVNEAYGSPRASADNLMEHKNIGSAIKSETPEPTMHDTLTEIKPKGIDIPDTPVEMGTPFTNAGAFINTNESLIQEAGKSIETNFDHIKHMTLADQEKFFADSVTLQKNLDMYENAIKEIKKSGVDQFGKMGNIERLTEKMDLVKNIQEKMAQLQEFHEKFKNAYEGIVQDSGLSMNEYIRDVLTGSEGKQMKVVDLVHDLNIGALKQNLEPLGNFVFDKIDPYNIKEQYAMTVDEFIQKVAQEQAE